MLLAGVDHITIAPALLQQLAQAPASSVPLSLFDTDPITLKPQSLLRFGDAEAAFRIQFTRSDNGEGERKLSQVNLKNSDVSYSLAQPKC